tara:strand:+ start:544 stop:975 length:432 start_codon:yes stop_codon:yes gene_type:complete
MSIFLGGTGSNNELHDYEEGTFTTNLPNGGSRTQSYARYIKVGHMVFVNFYIYSIQPPSNSNVFYIGGLPFTCDGVGHGFGNFAYTGGSGMSAVNLMPIVELSQTRMYFHRQDGTTAAWNNSQQRSTNWNQAFIIGAVYRTDS